MPQQSKTKSWHMEAVLSDLQKDPDFVSQVWSTDDFDLIWAWVQKGAGSVPLGSTKSLRLLDEDDVEYHECREDETFTFDVTTTAGRRTKRDMCLLACGKAHVLLKSLEKAGESVAQEVELLRKTDAEGWPALLRGWRR